MPNPSEEPVAWFFPPELGGEKESGLVFAIADVIAGDKDEDGVHVYLVSYLRRLFDMQDSDYASVLRRFRQDPDGTGRHGERLFAMQTWILRNFYAAVYRIQSPVFAYDPELPRENRGVRPLETGGRP